MVLTMDTNFTLSDATLSNYSSGMADQTVHRRGLSRIRLQEKLKHSVLSVQTTVIQESVFPDSQIADTPEKISSILKNCLATDPLYRPGVENFIVIFLNTRRRIISYQIAATGILDQITIHPREVFRSAILFNSSAIIVAHNHPSGDSSPSEADVRVTRDLIRAGQLLKIELLDHIILGEKYSSLRELGYFYS